MISIVDDGDIVSTGSNRNRREARTTPNKKAAHRAPLSKTN
jgi:hypothetical protein